MEVYLPYMIGSSITAFLGKVAYSYIYNEDNSNLPNKNADNNDVNNDVNNDAKNADNNNVNNDDKNDDNNNVINDIEYNMIDNKLNKREVNSQIDKRHLGSTFKEKMIALQDILEKECKRSYPINNTKKVRAIWIRFIKQYETIGHSEFVFSHNSKPYKSN